MRYRDKVDRDVSQVIPAGETFLAACPLEGGLIVGLAYRYRVVVVTDRAVRLYTASWFSVCKPQKLLATLPPGTVVQPTRRLNHQILHVAGERFWVKFAHWAEIREVAAASETLAIRSF